MTTEQNQAIIQIVVYQNQIHNDWVAHPKDPTLSDLFYGAGDDRESAIKSLQEDIDKTLAVVQMLIGKEIKLEGMEE